MERMSVTIENMSEMPGANLTLAEKIFYDGVTDQEKEICTAVLGVKERFFDVNGSIEFDALKMKNSLPKGIKSRNIGPILKVLKKMNVASILTSRIEQQRFIFRFPTKVEHSQSFVQLQAKISAWKAHFSPVEPTILGSQHKPIKVRSKLLKMRGFVSPEQKLFAEKELYESILSIIKNPTRQYFTVSMLAKELNMATTKEMRSISNILKYMLSVHILDYVKHNRSNFYKLSSPMSEGIPDFYSFNQILALKLELSPYILSRPSTT
jgi:hypothetical protein